ncbi:rhomboid-domain-containing protein [Trichodelitschia bisporula]|uniref:Rhomboid-type serine protease n=1 Tax=Trichodelitschia bisporula TaxID=703511 RepID=A0A6G1HP46_9PEZI|nr:rhomboid-domain-containing protein [Trichodelitschia bisporula]
MAANNYYDRTNTFTPHETPSYDLGQRTEAPLPPLPSGSSTKGNHPYVDTTVPQSSGMGSPFDDRAYPAQAQGPGYGNGGYDESPYNHGNQNGSGYSSSDPFADRNAIPLQSQKPLPEVQGLDDPENQPPKRGKRRRGKQPVPKGRITWAVYFLSLVQFTVFVVEIIKNATLTGSPIEIHPSFNPMIGPSPYVLINLGARYTPCMREIPVTIDGHPEALTAASPAISHPCPNTTTGEAKCTLATLCGNGLNLDANSDGMQPQPNQWWRFITPIFLHGGIIHIGFNLLLQLTLGRDIERQIGLLRFVLVYMSAGIFGFVFGGNFAPNGLPSMGCSGSLFGILAIVLLDLLYTWRTRPNPIRDLCFVLLDVVISFVLGLLPGLDNFSHIGGFIVGLLLGICILHSPDPLRQRIGLDEPPYTTVEEAQKTGVQSFVRQPMGFFKGRKPLWWAWWLVRAGALLLVLISFILLLRNFYVFEKKCSWCKYLSCLPIKTGNTNWCDVGNLQFKNETTPTKVRRDALLWALGAAGF